jgi:hydrogenase expression/formation protein HypC
VSLLVLDVPVSAGDWVVCHSGFALSRVSAEQARDAAALRATITPH